MLTVGGGSSNLLASRATSTYSSDVDIDRDDKADLEFFAKMQLETEEKREKFRDLERLGAQPECVNNYEVRFDAVTE